MHLFAFLNNMLLESFWDPATLKMILIFPARHVEAHAVVCQIRVVFIVDWTRTGWSVISCH